MLKTSLLRPMMVYSDKKVDMSIKWLLATLLAGCSALAQEPAPSVDLATDDNGLLSLSWESDSNSLYRVLFKTNLLQAQGTVLKDDYFATPPSNLVKIYRGSVPSAFLYVDAQPVLQSDLPYELLYPGSFSVSPGETNVVYSGSPTFVGVFCVTNEVQYESLKEELGLAGHTFDFSSEVLIGTMGPLTSSIGGRYQMDSVRETASEVLVVYNYISYAPYCMPAFDKSMLVVRTEHRNKPVRLVFNRVITPYMEQESLNIVLSLDSQQFPFFSP